MISRKSKREKRKSTHASIQSVETKQNWTRKIIIEVNDKWTKIKVPWIQELLAMHAWRDVSKNESTKKHCTKAVCGSEW